MHWGQAIKTARKKRSITQQQLGERIGKPQSEIAHIEQRADLLTSTVELLALGLGATCEEISRYALEAAEPGEGE
jgi:transcriptional regulator with XRE-family HTH domain